MRTITIPVAGLPAGTQYEVLQDRDGIRRVRWIQDDLPRLARVDGKGKLAELTAAGPIYDHHCSQLGVNPETEIPCGRCGAEIPACLTLCPECWWDPDSETPCLDCEEGHVDICKGPYHVGRVTCGVCGGRETYESADYRNRIDAIEAAKRWEAGQKMEPVPARIGGGR